MLAKKRQQYRMEIKDELCWQKVWLTYDDEMAIKYAHLHLPG